MEDDELHPEVRDFLIKMGKLPGAHQATQEVKPLQRVKRGVLHDPPAWGPITTSNWPQIHRPARLAAMRRDEAELALQRSLTRSIGVANVLGDQFTGKDQGRFR